MIEKRTEFLKQWDAGKCIRLHLDPRRDYVNIPRQLRQVPHLILEYGFDLPTPITDLFLSEQGLEATLSINRSPVFTFIPWAAVFAISTTDTCEVAVWTTDVPPEVQLGLPVETSRSKPRLSLVPDEKPRLSLVPLGGGCGEPAGPVHCGEGDVRCPDCRPPVFRDAAPFLRVVK